MNTNGRSLLKFFNRQQNDAGQQLLWPGLPQGYPVLGPNAPDLKGDEIEKVPVRIDYKSKLFDLSNEKDCAEYNQIMDQIVNGLYHRLDHDRRWNDAKQHYQIWLEWAEFYGEPSNLQQGFPDTLSHTRQAG